MTQLAGNPRDMARAFGLKPNHIYRLIKSGAVWPRAHARKSLMPVWRASSGLNSMPLVGNCTGNVRLLLRASPSRWATRTVLSAWLKKHQTTNLGVGGSNPSGRASKFNSLSYYQNFSRHFLGT